VIVKLKEAVGEEQLPDGSSRGCLSLSTDRLHVNEPILVLQHPKGRTLELAIGPLTGWMAGRESEVYEHLANTDDGSSGSTCFSFGWKLVAMHHRVDEARKRNRAIASTAILTRMGSVGTIGLLPDV
jgi:hypothetical protein